MLYDTIGKGYAAQRVPDPRIARQVLAALGQAATVINVGAGTGSYEPRDRPVIAVEPSMTMIRQRSAGAPPVIQAVCAPAHSAIASSRDATRWAPLACQSASRVITTNDSGSGSGMGEGSRSRATLRACAFADGAFYRARRREALQ